MSVPARFWALAQDTKGSERQVLNCLADWMIGDDAVVCWPSVETIAFETGCNRQTVMKATDSLKQAGLITKKRRLVNDEWRMHYTLVGYVPTEWVNAERPTLESTKNRKYEKPDFQNPVRTGNRTSESPKNRTSESADFRTLESTKNRTRTGNNKEDKERNKEVLRAPAGAPYPEDFDQSLFDEAQREAQLAGEKTTDEPPMKEEKPKRKRSSNVQKPESVSEQVWNDFTALRTKRRAPITETALKGIQREAEKAGITLEEALSTCCERGWQGFKAEWYSRATAKSSSPAPSSGGRYLTAQERYEERMRKAGEMSDAEYMAQFLRPTPLEIEARQRKNHESA